MSSDLLYCKTTLLKKQLISQYYSVDRKSAKNSLLYIVLAIERYENRNFSIKAGFANYFSKILADFSKLDLSRKLLEKFWFSFTIPIAKLLIYNLPKSS